jgi:class 3 adenylate cyclase
VDQGPPLPEHPELREVALAMESAGVAGDILDADWREVFMSSEMARMAGFDPADVVRYYGRSLIELQFEEREIFGITDEGSVHWWRQNAPMMRRYLEADDPAFGPLANAAARVAPAEWVPRAWHSIYDFPLDRPYRQRYLSGVTFLETRINDDSGAFIGIARISRSVLPESLLTSLGRGDRGLFERMQRVSEPARRAAGILFADLEASGTLSRRLSSRGYFEIISGLTDLIDSAVIENTGITGKHAGDGASALFLAGDFGGSESQAAAASILAARAIRAGAAELGPEGVDVLVNVGVHWGATLMVGQVATGGRLEVTALGDEMNEAARIEAVATGGAVLASKNLLERLDDGDARAVGVDPATLAYTPLGELPGAGAKAVRDAGSIPVTAI